MKKRFWEGKHQYLRNLVMLLGFLVFSSYLAAIEPPRPGDIEKYKQDGTWQQRLDFALALKNHEPSESVVALFNYRMDRLFYQRQGKSDDEINSLIGARPPWADMPSKGTVKVLVLLIAFQDYQPNPADTPEAIAEKLFGNGTDPIPYDSLRNFYQRSSYGQLNLEGNVLGWYTTPYPRDQVPQTYLGRENLIKEALTYYDSQGHDFTQYDNDKNGTIDCLTVVWTGPDNGWANFWWGYMTGFGTVFRLDGKQFRNYSWQWEAIPYPGLFRPDTVIHETSHVLGIPDYYDYDATVGPDGGAGGLDANDGGGDHNCFSKYLMDWINPTVIGSGTQQVTLHTSGTFGDAVMIMPATTGDVFREFFMVQNRFRSGNDLAPNHPSDGLIIWHVDARLNEAKTYFLYNNSFTAHKLLRLMEADGLEEIEQNKGPDAGDYYVAGSLFTPWSKPNSSNYAGATTKVCVTDISPVASQMTCSAGITNQSLDVTTPNGGQVWLMNTVHSITWTKANISGTIHIELHDIGGKVMDIADVPATATSYAWTIPATLSPGNDYRIRLSCGIVSDFSNASFTIVPAASYLIVTSPNGGEKWELGKTNLITWVQKGLSGTAAIALYRGETKLLDIGSAGVAAGKFSWTIPSSLYPGGGYKIRITNASFTDDSNRSFEIVMPFPQINEYFPPVTSWIDYIDVHGHYAAIAERNNTIHLIDVMYPAHPQVTATIQTNAAWISDLKISGNYLYTLEAGKGLVIYDISDPAAPTLTGIYPCGYAHIAVSGSMVYVLGYDLRIVDVSNPAHPVQKSRINFGVWEQNLFFDNGYVYVTHNPQGLKIFDVHNPASPVLAGEITEHAIRKLFVRYGHAYLRTAEELLVYDVSNPSVPVLVGRMPEDDDILSMVVSGRYAFLMSWNNLTLVDISDPGNLFVAGSNAQMTGLLGMDVANGIIYLFDNRNSIRFLQMPYAALDVQVPDGNETWKLGSTQEVTWSARDLQGDVTLELYRQTAKILTIGTAPASSGRLSWTIPADPALESNYTVRVSQAHEEDSSDQVFVILTNEPLINLSQRKPATQSSTNDGKGAALAVDGNTDGNYFNLSVSCTKNEYQAWWQVDLQGNYLIHQVNLYRRTDCCPERLTNFNVRISLDGDNWQDFNYPGQAGSPTVIATGGVIGRYVRIQLVGTNYLSLAEVQVMGENSKIGITVTAPNGGESWFLKTTQAITWNATNLSGNVAIELYKGDAKVLDIGNAAADAGSFSWYIPFNLTVGTDYKIRIHQGGIEDYSDKPFSIVMSGPLTNLALRKPATQSSTYGGKTANLAVDGNYNNLSVSCTNNQAQAWWQVDLQANYRIFQVNVYNRTDCCPQRLTNFNVRISLDNNNWQDFNYPGQAGSPTIISTGGVIGRYVRIQLVGTDYLSLAEVQVLGDSSGTYMTVTSPNGGESWIAGTTHAVTWTSSGNIANVRVEYSTDSGTTWNTIIASTPNTGSYDWTVPNTPSSTCLVLVSDAGEAAFDASNNNFSIIANEGTVSGRVTDASGNGISGIHVQIRTLDNTMINGWNTGLAGTFSISGIPAGTCKVYFYAYGQNYISQWYNNKSTFDAADPVMVSAGQVTANINAVLAVAGSISGTVTNDSGSGIQGIRVYAYDVNGNYASHTVTNSSGLYSILGLAGGNYKVFFDHNVQNYVSEWYNDHDSYQQADPVPVTQGQVTGNINAVLYLGASISGRVTDVSGSGVNPCTVIAYSYQNDEYGFDCPYAFPDSSGNYQIVGLASGTYLIQFRPGNYVPKFFPNTDFQSEAARVAVTAGQPYTGYDIVLSKGGTITGTITDENGNGPDEVYVRAYDAASNRLMYLQRAGSANGGQYTFNNVPPGQVKLHAFTSYVSTDDLISEFYNDKPDPENADPVLVNVEQTTSGINFVLSRGSGKISGFVRNGSGTGLANAIIKAYDLNGNFMGWAISGPDGSYELKGLRAGAYKVSFQGNWYGYPVEWYNDKTSFAEAMPVAVTLGQTTPLNIVLGN